MKVLFFLSQLPPVTGGELYNYRLYRFLQGQGMDTEAFIMEKHLAAFRRKLGPLARVPILEKVLLSLLCLWRFRGKGGVIVEGDSYPRELFFYKLVQKYIRRCKIITTLMHYERGYDSGAGPVSAAVRALDRLCFSLADRLITISHYSRDQLVSLGVNPAKVQVLPPGVDREALATEERDRGNKDGFNLLFVGHCYPRKGVLYLVEAFSQINHPDAVLHIVGDTAKDGPYFKKCQNLVAQRGLEERVIFHGRVEQEALSRLYAQADIFVLPSLLEGFGIVLLEAMYFGLPIIASNVSAIPELVEDGGNGILVPPADAAALAEAISRLLENPGLRQRMGENGRRKVLNSYSWEKTEQGFYELVQALSV